MISGFLRSVSFAIGVGLSVAAFGQANPPGGASTPPTSLTAADLNFAKEAAIGGHLEVDAGRIAERGAEEGGRDQAHARRQRALLPPVSGSREKKDAAVAEPVASSAPKRRKRAG